MHGSVQEGPADDLGVGGADDGGDVVTEGGRAERKAKTKKEHSEYFKSVIPDRYVGGPLRSKQS